MRISDWSSDVCSSDLRTPAFRGQHAAVGGALERGKRPQNLVDRPTDRVRIDVDRSNDPLGINEIGRADRRTVLRRSIDHAIGAADRQDRKRTTSELQSLMRISYAVFCLKNTTHTHKTQTSPKI